MYLKNDTSPKPIYAILVNASDGSPITSGVAAYHIQGTTRTPGQGTLTHIANGRWAYVPTQAETNYDAFAIDFYHADAVGKGALVEVVTANAGLAVITSDTSAIRQAVDAKLDVAVSTRLASGDYEAPDNDSLAAIKEVVEANLDTKVSTRLASEDYVDPDNNSISTIKEIVQDKLDEKVSSRLASQSYVAPDNASISAIKTQTDKLQFDSNNYVYAVGIGGGGGVQVVVQPLTASVQRTDGAGGVISGWTYARLVASWNVKDVNLSGHDLRLILYNRNDPASAIVEYSTGAGEITITYNNPDSLVEVDGPDSKTPNAGNYAYVLRDQTTDTVLLSGNCLIQAAPDAG